MHKHALQPTLNDKQFLERFAELHRQLWRSTPPNFDDATAHIFTPQSGMYQVDHAFFHDGEQWHLYYLTGDMTLSEPWNECRRAEDYEGANRVCVEPGNGHAVGATLFDLKFVEHIFFEPQGRFDLASRGCCSLFEFEGQYGMLYDVRGEDGEKMSLAWSDDLCQWKLDERNPVLNSGSWANPNGSFKDPHVMKHAGVYLIYVVAWNRNGQPCIALITTEDWKTFHDHGPVFTTAPQLRGTFGLESPQVILRDGMWHLFYTQGEGLWHAISPSPITFLERGDVTSKIRPTQGAYLAGRFHACEIVYDGTQWWLTSDRKEHQRYLNRLAGRPLYRGQYEDEKPLEEGLFLSEILWNGDQPTFVKPRKEVTASTTAHRAEESRI